MVISILNGNLKKEKAFFLSMTLFSLKRIKSICGMFLYSFIAGQIIYFLSHLLRKRFSLFFSECRFADKRYELEEVWHPDLGPPFGVMYCVHCECVPVRTNVYYSCFYRLHHLTWKVSLSRTMISYAIWVEEQFWTKSIM